MFLIPRRQIWTQQPQTEAAVAAEYLALNPKLIVNYGASPNDLVSSKFPVAVNRAYGVDAQGKGLKGSSGVAQYAARLTGKEMTIVISVTPGDYAGSSQMLLETEVASAARTEGSLMLLPYYNTAGANASLWNLCVFPSDGINYTYGSVVFPAPTAGIPHTLAIRINRNLTGAAKILSIHIDGVAQALTPRLDGGSNTQNSNSNFNTNNIYINHRAGALLPGAHNVHFVGVFGSLFSSEKAKSLSDNPWQIFKRPDSRIFVPVSAGGTTTSLIVQDATHAHVADGVTLTTQWMLTVAEALHGHAADNITLGVTGTANLAIADATSGHTSDTVALTLNSLLAVFDAIHAHSADNLTLDTSNATALTVQDSTHAHGADNLGLSLDTWLAIVEAAHGHTADAPMLSLGQLSLQIADALHAMYSDIVFLTLPGGNLTTDQKFIIRATARRLAAIGLARNNIINRRAS